MPTLYNSAAPDKLLIIRGLDANPVYLPLYVGLKIEEILYSVRNSAVLFSELAPYAICCIGEQTNPQSAEHIAVPVGMGLIPRPQGCVCHQLKWK